MTNEPWIEQSLIRLEELETLKLQLEHSGDLTAVADLEAEISALYRRLESARAQATTPSQPLNTPSTRDRSDPEAMFSSPPGPAVVLDTEDGYGSRSRTRSRLTLVAVSIVIALGGGGAYYMLSPWTPASPSSPSSRSEEPAQVEHTSFR